MRKSRLIRRYLPLVVGVALVMPLMVPGPAPAVSSVVWSGTIGGTPFGTFWEEWNWVDGEPTSDPVITGGATDYLEAQFASDFVPGSSLSYKCPTPAGKFKMGTYSERMAIDSATGVPSGTWTDGSDDVTGGAFRTNPLNMIAERTGLAADGADSWILYASQVCYYSNKAGSGKRVLYVRHNDNYLDPVATYDPAVRLTSAKGRVDYPYIDAEDGLVVVAWTDANKCNVFVSTSTNGGATFTKHKVGTTTNHYFGYGDEGCSAQPAVGTDGDLVGVALQTTKKGKAVARMSTNKGVTWGPNFTLAPSGTNKNASLLGAGAAEGRIGFSWTTPTGLFYVEASPAFGTKMKIATTPDAMVPKHWAYEGPAVALFGAGQVGVAFGACRNKTTSTSCPQGNKISQEDLLYVESADNGATWPEPPTLVALAGLKRSATANNNWPSLDFYDADTRFLLWTAWDPYYTTGYFVLASTGEGAGP